VKVQLIHPANDEKHVTLQNGYKIFPPPIGLEIIANYLIDNLPDVEVQVFDGNSTSYAKIFSQIDADIVGISDWFTNHNTAMKFAREVKWKNPNTLLVAGGPNASNLGERILVNHNPVDYVVYGDGEEAMKGIVTKSSPEKIPNIWYKTSDGEIKFTFKKAFNINTAPSYNLDHLIDFNLEKYDSRMPSYTNDISLSPMPVSSIRGCIKAARHGACSFCALVYDSAIVIKNAENFWAQIALLNARYGINKFFETGDSFVFGNYPERLLKAKPHNLDIHLRIYANIETLSPEKIEALARIGVKEIFIGIENISNSVLSHLNKQNDKSCIIEVLDNLKIYDISPILSFIAGLPGETKETLYENHAYAESLAERFPNMNLISFNAGVPLIGSAWFTSLINNGEIRDRYWSFTGKSLYTDDDIDYEFLLLLSLKYFTSITFYDLYAILNKPIHPRLIDRNAGWGCIAGNIKDSSKHIEYANRLLN
jgi:radical SAM superfamily enzyme YgiQ (UPF0313 family)